MTTPATARAVTIGLSLPVAILSKSRRGWISTGVSRSGKRYYASEFGEAFKQLKQDAYVLFREQVGPEPPFDAESTWVASVIWRQAGVLPDADNIIGRCAAILDAAQQAGVVANDKQIRWGTVAIERVPRKDQGIRFTLTRQEPT